MRLEEVVAPGQEPLEKDEVKLWLRLEQGYTDEDDLLDGLIAAARVQAEGTLNLKLITQEWRYWLDEWPDKDYIELPHALSTGTTSPVIKYYMTASTEKTFGRSTYWQCDSVSVPGRLHLRYGEDWPSKSLRDFNPISVTYQTGFGGMSSAVQQDIRLAMKLIVNHWYENREPYIVGQIIHKVPDAVEALLAKHRNWRF